jgi:transposase InsO family protein
VAMSVKSRREYVAVMRERYRRAKTRQEKTQLLAELESTCGYHRKYAIRLLRSEGDLVKPRRVRRRQLLYEASLPVIQLAWEALDYPCAERLHPVLLATAELLAAHGELVLTAEVRQQLSSISRATLARRLAELPTPKPRRMFSKPKPGSLLHSEIPLGRYDWDEQKPGALEIDLVEHNGGSSSGHYAYTLNVVDIVTGWSRRRAILGRSQVAVHSALTELHSDWPYAVWGLHSDNGAEFISKNLTSFARRHSLEFTRSRPYRKNDNAHVEQRNRQFVRDIVGYARYDTPQHVTWLNEVYAILDVYANFFLPTRRIIAKTRTGARVRKTYDQAATPFDRACTAGAINPTTEAKLRAWIQTQNPLALRRKLDQLIAVGPQTCTVIEAAD